MRRLWLCLVTWVIRNLYLLGSGSPSPLRFSGDSLGAACSLSDHLPIRSLQKAKSLDHDGVTRRLEQRPWFESSLTSCLRASGSLNNQQSLCSPTTASHRVRGRAACANGTALCNGFRSNTTPFLAEGRTRAKSADRSLQDQYTNCIWL